MGFSLTGTHVIFFIAAVIVAGMVSGVFIAEIMNITTSLSQSRSVPALSAIAEASAAVPADLWVR